MADGVRTFQREGRDFESVNRVMGITEWGLMMILSTLWGAPFSSWGRGARGHPVDDRLVSGGVSRD